MQAYIKYKAYYDKKANATKLKQSVCVYILQPKADHQGSKISFTDFRWIGPYIVEKVLPNNNYVLRKIGTNKTKILHRMRVRHFTPRQPIPNIPVTPREWQPDPEIIIKHDDLYARAWECEYDKSIFDSDSDNVVSPNSPVRSGEEADATSSTPGTTQEDSSNIPPPHTQTKWPTEPIRITICSLMRTIAKSKLTLRLPTPAAQNMIYAITLSQIATTTTDIKS